MIKNNETTQDSSRMNSKFLIQPIFNSSNYIIADVTDIALDNKTYTAATFQFY